VLVAAPRRAPLIRLFESTTEREVRVHTLLIEMVISYVSDEAVRGTRSVTGVNASLLSISYLDYCALITCTCGNFLDSLRAKLHIPACLKGRGLKRSGEALLHSSLAACTCGPGYYSFSKPEASSERRSV
jgi:hypothetical protein